MNIAKVYLRQFNGTDTLELGEEKTYHGIVDDRQLSIVVLPGQF